MKKAIKISLLLAMLPVLVLFSGCAERKQSPHATLGVLDLSEWDFDENGPVALNGEWEIYWQWLLTPDDFSGPVLLEPTGFIAIPKLWGGYRVGGIRLSHQGHATLRLNLRLPVDHIPLVIQIDTGKGARKIWIDDELLIAVGEVGTNAETVRASIGAPITYHAGKGGQTREFVVQIANYSYHHLFTSFFRITIGKYDDLRFWNTLQAGIDIFILGALFFMGLYHATLYLFRKTDLSNLYFSAVCLLYGTWSAVNGLGYVHWKTALMNGDSWLGVAYVTDLLFYPLLPVFVMYVHSIFPSECSKAAVRISQVTGAIWCAAKILVHFCYDIRAFEILFRAMFHPTWRPFLLIFTALLIYIIIIVVVAAVRKRPNSYFMLTSLTLLLACGVHDLLQLTNIFSKARLLAIGFFCMILSQSFILARRFALSFLEVEQLSEKLRRKNIALSQMDKKKEKARLLAEKEGLEKLRYQLNPHFLFNALASIRGALLRDREVAHDLISHLAQFSRLTLSRGSLDTLTVNEELEVIRHYLAMEQIRFGDYLTVSFEAESEAGNVEVPALVLQPLVENAIKYGSRTSPDTLVVSISVKMQPPDMIRLLISNSGNWVEPGSTDSRYSTGTGIKNIKQRLKKYYLKHYRFDTREAEGQVRIEIDLPRVIQHKH